MSTDTQNSKKLNFWQLLQEHKIEIPIIQRDYAQGREDKTEIRERFLQSIFEALSDDKSLELDFIYGSIDLDFSMQPLDGQQRLTTLYLLHWYFANKENKTAESKSILKKFTYETRISSREFSEKLTDNTISLNDLLPADIDKNNESYHNELSKTIINSPWFFLSWKKDPTIKAMLTMLDAIHKKANNPEFRNINNFWFKLTNEGIISFNYIELKNFGLSDDLYIKMNARGKSLTDFENFKASFEKKIKVEGWENEVKKTTETFSHKVDTVWTDLFWEVRDAENLTDNAFVKFISSQLMTSLALSDKTKEEKELRIRELLNNPNTIDSNDFDLNSFNHLKESFDVYSNKKNSIAFHINLWDYLNKESNFFNTITKGEKLEYQKIVLFYAQTQYLLKNKVIENLNFSNWIRVIRNIIVNSTIDSAETFVGAIKLVNELSAGSDNIYEHIANNNVKSDFAKSQIKEETLKSKLICYNNKYSEVIFKTEDTNFCKGRITFALDCIEVDENNIESFSFEKLSKIQEVIKKYLSETDISDDFRRGLFTSLDNQFYDYWDTSWLYAVNAPKRRMILNINDLKNFAYNSNFKKYLIDLVQKLTLQGLNELIDSYEIPNEMPNWKVRLIKEKKLLEKHSPKHYMAIKEDQSCCWLIRGSKVANTKEGKDKCKKIN